MHVADPLSRHSDHYVHSSEDNKEQILLQPETVNKIIDASEKSHDDHQSIISEFHDLPAAGHKGSKATYNMLRKHYKWKVSRPVPLTAVVLGISFLIATAGSTCTSPTVVLVCAHVFW